MKKQLLALICAFAFVGNVTAGIKVMSCEELKEAIASATKAYNAASTKYFSLLASDIAYKEKEGELNALRLEIDNQLKNVETYSKDFNEQGCE